MACTDTMPRISPPVPNGKRPMASAPLVISGNDTDTEGEDDNFVLLRSDSDSSHDDETERAKCISAIHDVCKNKRNHRFDVPLMYLAEHYRRRFTLREIERIPELKPMLEDDKGQKTSAALFKYVNIWIKPRGYEVYNGRATGRHSRYEYWMDRAGLNSGSASASAKRARPWDYTDLNREAVMDYMSTTPLDHIKNTEALRKRIRVLEQFSVEEMQQTLSRVQKERDELQEKLVRANDDREALSTKENIIEEEKRVLKCDVSALTEKNEELKKRVTEASVYSVKAKGLQTQLGMATEGLQKAHSQLKVLDDRVKLMEASNMQLKASQETLNRLLAEERNKTKEHEALKLSLETEKKALQESAKISSDQAVANNREVNRLKSELDKAAAEKAQLRKKIDAMFDGA